MSFFKIKSIFKNSRVFINYIISYSIVLLVPVFILSFIMFGIFINILKEEVVENTINSLNKTKNAIDIEINQLYSICYQIMNTNASLTTYLSMPDSPIRDLYIKNEIRKHTASNFFASLVVLYLRDEEYVYTSQGVYRLDIFMNSLYSYENWKLKDFIRDITVSREPFARPAEKVNENESYITFVFPNYKLATIPKASLLFLVPENKVRDLLSSNIEKDKGSTLIIDREKRIITTSNDEVINKHINSSEFIYFIESLNNKDGVFERKIAGTNYFIVVVNSNYFGWKYVSLLPMRTVLAKVLKVKLVYLIGLVVVFIIGTIFILLFMKINYMPIKRLKVYLSKFIDKNRQELDEIEMVHDAVAYLVSQNEKLKYEVSKNIHALKDALVFSLIKGQMKTIEQFNKIGRELGIEFTKKYFQVAIVQADVRDYDNSFNRDVLVKIVDSCIFDGYEYYIRDDIQENQYIILLAFEEEDSSKLDLIMENILKKGKQYGILLTIGIGDKYDNPQFISKSYMNASFALDYKFIRGKGKIIYYRDIVSHQFVINDYPKKKDIEKLGYLIKQGNINEIQQIIESIARYIRMNHVPIFIAKGLYFEIIHEIFNNIDENLIVRSKYPDVFLLGKIETMEEMVEIIKEICFDICSAIERSRLQNKETCLIDRILNFIQQNYDNCSFSNQMIAENLGVTVPYLSQYFKTKTGKTILEYVTELRIKKAKQLLLNTDLSLNHIAEEIGYYNVSSFIRRFKQIEGITPGEFREKSIKKV